MIEGVHAVTFDIFGTLLTLPSDLPWLAEYAKEFVAIERGEKPYRTVSEMFKDYGADWTKLTPRDGVIEAIHKLRQHYFVAPLSNADYQLSEEIAVYFGLEWSGMFDVEKVKTFKPNPDVYNHCLRRMGLNDASKVIHCASHIFDLEAAKALGFRTAAIDWPGYMHWPSITSERYYKYDFRVKSITELVDLLI